MAAQVVPLHAGPPPGRLPYASLQAVKDALDRLRSGRVSHGAHVSVRDVGSDSTAKHVHSTLAALGLLDRRGYVTPRLAQVLKSSKSIGDSLGEVVNECFPAVAASLREDDRDGAERHLSEVLPNESDDQVCKTLRFVHQAIGKEGRLPRRREPRVTPARSAVLAARAGPQARTSPFVRETAERHREILEEALRSALQVGEASQAAAISKMLSTFAADLGAT